MNNIEIGWYSLIDKVNDILKKLSFGEIESIKREHAMLKIKFGQRLDKLEQYILDSISHRIERESVRLCEGCGKFGARRMNLTVPQCLCIECYALKYNDMMESVSPQVTIETPQS